MSPTDTYTRAPAGARGKRGTDSTTARGSTAASSSAVTPSPGSKVAIARSPLDGMITVTGVRATSRPSQRTPSSASSVRSRMPTSRRPSGETSVRGQPQPRRADRGDRAAAGRAHEVLREALLARARDRVQPDHRQVEERPRLGSTAQVRAAALERKRLLQGGKPLAVAIEDLARRGHRRHERVQRQRADRQLLASRAAPRRSSCARRPSSARPASARARRPRRSPAGPARRGRRRTAPRPRRCASRNGSEERFAVLRISTSREFSAIASSTAIASFS